MVTWRKAMGGVNSEQEVALRGKQQQEEVFTRKGAAADLLRR